MLCKDFGEASGVFGEIFQIDRAVFDDGDWFCITALDIATVYYQFLPHRIQQFCKECMAMLYHALYATDILTFVELAN